MPRMFGISLLAILYLAAAASAADNGPTDGRLSAVPFTQVKFDDAFWSPRLKTNRDRSLPHNIQWCEQTGRINNFLKAGGKMEGKFEGIFFNDSDVYKVLEGASYSLADHPDPVLDKKVDEVIAAIAGAQQKDGYINTYYTLAEPGKRWTNLKDMHELYCGGHMIEAGVAHFRATGKRTFLDVCIRFADYLCKQIGPDKRHDVPGHEEIELALVKLFQVTGEQRYFDLAKFMVDIRGDKAQRPVWGEYHQDHKPVREQDEIVGHAVRAMYLYCGTADVASYSDDKALIGAMDRLWKSVVDRKMYITGGIGAKHEGEAFGADFELPNESAYCETCAAIGLALWAHRLNMLHGDAAYADIVERTIYNGVLSGIGMDGKTFFYVNPLASNGNHHRQPFFDCACCPSNVVRFVPSLPGYVYAVGGNGLFVNLYVAGTGKVKVANTQVEVRQETLYPWDGRVKITVTPEQAAAFAVNLRVPGWCRDAKIVVNGQTLDKIDLVKGYARIVRPWKPGDVIEMDLPMPVERIEANPLVKADMGRVALQRGPVVYCFEAVDNPDGVTNIQLAKNAEFAVSPKPDLLGGVSVIRATERSGRDLLAVPYFAWDHRKAGDMAVWVRQDGKVTTAPTDDSAWQGILYRPLDSKNLGPSQPLSISESSKASASHVFGNDSLRALSDQAEMRDSNDHSIPRFTWWDHLGTKEWVQYDFDAAKKVSAVEVYWFDDERSKAQCRGPQSWQLLYKEGDQWKPVEDASGYGCQLDRFNRTTFKPAETTALRLEVQLKKDFSGGILEWKVE